MIKKSNKFTRQDFAKMREVTKYKVIASFGLVYFINESFGKSTIVIPKKVYKKANERNRIKRIFYNNLNNQHLAVFIKSKLSPLQFKVELVKIIENKTK